ncbi:hypothetical protein QO016_005042, partial [Methylobacterium persicinum]|nr:hypothetical protein [Methylobacterium persicinum]
MHGRSRMLGDDPGKSAIALRAIVSQVQRGNQDETSASIKVRGTADLMTQGGRSPTGG